MEIKLSSSISSQIKLTTNKEFLQITSVFLLFNGCHSKVLFKAKLVLVTFNINIALTPKEEMSSYRILFSLLLMFLYIISYHFHVVC